MIELPREYVNSVCEIKTLENEIVGTGIISHIDEEYLQIAEKNLPLPLVSYGTMVKVNVFNSTLGFRVVIGTVLSTSIKFLKLVEVSSLLDYERRNFFRIETDMLASIVDVYPDGTFVEIGSVILRDLSLGGALLEFPPNMPIERGNLVTVRIRLGHIFCNFKCRICRLIKTDKGIRYGCEFEDMGSAQTDALCSFVFQRQRERINKPKMDHLK